VLQVKTDLQTVSCKVTHT